MKRRNFLRSAVATGATMSIAGCGGYTVEQSDEIEQKEATIENQSARIEELNGRVADLESEVESLNQTNAELESTVEQAKSDLDAAEGKQVLYLYSTGLTNLNNGIDFYNSAIDRFNAGNYRGSRADFNVASGYFDGAANDFKRAAERAGAIGASTVRQYARDAKQYASISAQECADYQMEMYHRLQGNESKAEEFRNKGDTHARNAESYTVRDLSKLEDLLGTTVE